MDITTDFRRKMIIRLIEVLKESPSFGNISLAQLKEAVLNSEHQTFQQSKTKEEYIYYINEKLKKIQQSLPQHKFENTSAMQAPQRKENCPTESVKFPSYTGIYPGCQQQMSPNFPQDSKAQSYPCQFDDLNGQSEYFDKNLGSSSSYDYTSKDKSSNIAANKFYKKKCTNEYSNPQKTSENGFSNQVFSFTNADSIYQNRYKYNKSGMIPPNAGTPVTNSGYTIKPIKARIIADSSQIGQRTLMDSQEMGILQLSKSPVSQNSNVPGHIQQHVNFYPPQVDHQARRQLGPDDFEGRHANVDLREKNFVKYQPGKNETIPVPPVIRAGSSMTPNKKMEVPLNGKKNMANFQDHNMDQSFRYFGNESSTNDYFYKPKYNSLNISSEFRPQNEFLGKNNDCMNNPRQGSGHSKFIPINSNIDSRGAPGFRYLDFQTQYLNKAGEHQKKSLNNAISLGAQEQYYNMNAVAPENQSHIKHNGEMKDSNGYNSGNPSLYNSNQVIKQNGEMKDSNGYNSGSPSLYNSNQISKPIFNNNPEFDRRIKYESNQPDSFSLFNSKDDSQQIDLMSNRQIIGNSVTSGVNNEKELFAADSVLKRNLFKDGNSFQNISSPNSKQQTDPWIFGNLSAQSKSIEAEPSKCPASSSEIDSFFESNVQLPFQPLKDTFEMVPAGDQEIPDQLKIFLDQNNLELREIEYMSTWKSLFDKLLESIEKKEIVSVELDEIKKMALKQKEFINYIFLDDTKIKEYLEKINCLKPSIEYKVLMDNAIKAFTKKKNVDKNFSLSHNEQI